MAPQKNKIIDYRSVRASWLISFRDDIMSNKLGKGLELVLANEDHGDMNKKEFACKKGDTLFVESSNPKKKKISL